MKEFIIRRAEQADLEHILNIYEGARQFMARTGNPTQWKNGYPQKELLEADIRKGQLYVVTDAQGIHGAFVFFVGEDPTYARILDGTWRSTEPYGVIHKVAGDGTGGIFSACLKFCQGRCAHLRIDTHENNRVMQHVVEKAGFRRRGIIMTHDGTPRIAYDMI